jgi:hypothetical protein
MQFCLYLDHTLLLIHRSRRCFSEHDAITIITYNFIREVLGSNRAGTSVILTKDFHGFPQSIHKNNRIVLSFPSKSFLISHSTTILPSDAIGLSPVILTYSHNNPQKYSLKFVRMTEIQNLCQKHSFRKFYDFLTCIFNTKRYILRVRTEITDFFSFYQ